MTLTVPADVAAQLRADADRLHVAPERLAADRLRIAFPTAAPPAVALTQNGGQSIADDAVGIRPAAAMTAEEEAQLRADLEEEAQLIARLEVVNPKFAATLRRTTEGQDRTGPPSYASEIKGFPSRGEVEAYNELRRAGTGRLEAGQRIGVRVIGSLFDSGALTQGQKGAPK